MQFDVLFPYLDGGEQLLVVVVGEDPPSVVVQDGDGLHRVQGGGLKHGAIKCVKCVQFNLTGQ